MISEILNFMHNHVFLGFCGIVLGAVIIVAIIKTPIRMWKYFMRHLNIRSQGWPPAHLDADGDFQKEDD